MGNALKNKMKINIFSLYVDKLKKKKFFQKVHMSQNSSEQLDLDRQD